VDISNFLSTNSLTIFLTLFFGFVGINTFRKTKSGKPIVDRLLLMVPLTGEVVRRVAISRFTSTMSTMMASGVAIMDALSICAESSGNALIEKFIMGVRDKIGAGSTFADPLGEGDLFPPMVVSMVAVGEQ